MTRYILFTVHGYLWTVHSSWVVNLHTVRRLTVRRCTVRRFTVRRLTVRKCTVRRLTCSTCRILFCAIQTQSPPKQTVYSWNSRDLFCAIQTQSPPKQTVYSWNSREHGSEDRSSLNFWFKFRRPDLPLPAGVMQGSHWLVRSAVGHTLGKVSHAWYIQSMGCVWLNARLRFDCLLCVIHFYLSMGCIWLNARSWFNCLLYFPSSSPSLHP